MESIINKYNISFTHESVKNDLDKLLAKSQEYKNNDVYKTIFSLIDLTTLSCTDTFNSVEAMCKKVNELKINYPSMPNVAAICVYPPFVACVKASLLDKNIGIASVAAGFPASQTFLEIKLTECDMAVDHGATDVDIVIPVGKFLEGDYSAVYSEVNQIKEVVGDAHLKVILETGAMTDPEQVKMASIIAIEAGGDFIKTSTGKMEPAATPEAVYVMCKIAKMHFDHTGKKIGIKPAGGIQTANDAITYYSIVKEVLGDEWLNPRLFRFGASRLANSLLSEIEGSEQKYF